MSDTPSAPIVAYAVKAGTIKDANGRELTIKRLSVSEKMKVKRIVSGDLADKLLLLQDLMFIASVREIDDVPRMPLTNMESYEKVGDLLGDAGMEAVLAFFMSEPDATPAEALVTAGN